jgi:hypothetical protein
MGTKENWKISSSKTPPPNPKLKREKCKAPSVCTRAFPLLNLIGPCQQKKVETVRAPKNFKILGIDGVPPPFAHLYM